MERFMCRVAVTIITIFMVACGGDSIHRSLENADRFMETNPDTSLTILQSIDTSLIAKNRDKALYGLLLTQAMVKKDIKIDNDSLIESAAEYFSIISESNYNMRSFYYLGYVRSRQNNIIGAIIPATKAYDISAKGEDYYWRGKTATLLADIFRYSWNNKETEKYVREAVSQYKNAGREDYYRYSMLDLARIKGDNGKLTDAVFILDSLIDYARNMPIDSGLLADCLWVKVSYLISLGEYDKALESQVELKKYPRFYTWSDDDDMCVSIIEKIKSGCFIVDSTDVRVYPRQVELSVKGSYYYTCLQQYYKEKDYKKALEYADSVIIEQNEKLIAITHNSIVSPQRDYYIETIVGERRRLRQLIWTTIITTTGLIIIIGCLALMYRLGRKVRRLQEDKLMKQIEELDAHKRINKKLLNSIAEKDKLFSEFEQQEYEKRRRLEMQIEKIYKERWGVFNMLCDEYYEKYDIVHLRKDIAANIYKEISKVKSKRSMHEIENMVDRYMDNIFTRLKEQCDFLSVSDIMFVTLLFAGFSARSVCLLMDLGYKNFYRKRSVLRDKIKESSAPDKDIFLQKMG